jgi:hypothetical protein
LRNAVQISCIELKRRGAEPPNRGVEVEVRVSKFSPSVLILCHLRQIPGMSRSTNDDRTHLGTFHLREDQFE